MEEVPYTKEDRQMLRDVHAAIVGSTDGTKKGLNARLERVERIIAFLTAPIGVVFGLFIKDKMGL